MAFDKNMVNLRNVLAGLYWSQEEARRIVLEIGLNPAFISISTKPIVTWTNILVHAGNQEAVGDIIAKAREEYPKLESLALAEQNMLLTIEAPEIPAGAWHGPTDELELEKLMGRVSTLRPIHYLQRGLAMSRSVARVVLHKGTPDESSGSGFLIDDNLLITNHHVIGNQEEARAATVEFNYQVTIEGRDAKVQAYTLVPEEGFATSPKEEDGGDDWTAVRVDGNPNNEWGKLSLAPAEPKVKDEVIIIQHPGGGPKQIALTHNTIAFVNDQRLQYLTDTLEGSSGSPVFDLDWRVVAVHHAGGLLREPGTKRAVYRNQGVHINVVIKGLAAARQAGTL